MSWKPRVTVKQRAKIDKALYKCELCNWYIYEGTSPVTYDYYLQVYGDNIRFDKCHMDHREPVVPIEGLGLPENFEWKIYFERLFCPEENWQLICLECHTTKTLQENEQRKLHKRKKK